MPILQLLLLVLLFSQSVSAAITLPGLFSNNMVLQQNTRVALWGHADAGEVITIYCSWNKKTVKVTADAQGNWLTRVITTKAGGPYTLSFKGKNEIALNNVLLGEVWLCSGQSNMNFPMEKQNGWRSGVLNYPGEIAQADFPNIRLFTVEQRVADTLVKNIAGNWQVCSPATVGKFSAVAYYFARELNRQTGLPIGLIHSSWGGTPAEAWTKKEVLMADTELVPIVERFEKAKKEFEKANAVYQEQLAQHKSDSATLRKPVEVNYNQLPSRLYNAMIFPLQPYTLKGVIWYQGESNSDRAWQYRKLFPAMIANWRKDWQSDFPFYFVQIAPYRMQKPEIRDAQLYTLKTVPRTGMAVITDAGDSIDIHPRNKELVGKRLALWALAKEYGKNVVYSGPVYRSMKKEGSNIRLEFDYTASGLVAKEGELKEFTIAGPDHLFVPAVAKIEDNTIVVWSEAVSQPQAVRFAWKNVPHPNLYNTAGLPASPFRTDDWEVDTYGLR